MHLLEGRDVAEVAQSMGRTANAVRVLYCRALRALREEVPELA
jgi:DNA-directed RNA polymerase specialized sigma24 family protein